VKKMRAALPAPASTTTERQAQLKQIVATAKKAIEPSLSDLKLEPKNRDLYLLLANLFDHDLLEISFVPRPTPIISAGVFGNAMLGML
jgi:hypothetical protein